MEDSSYFPDLHGKVNINSRILSISTINGVIIKP